MSTFNPATYASFGNRLATEQWLRTWARTEGIMIQSVSSRAEEKTLYNEGNDTFLLFLEFPAFSSFSHEEFSEWVSNVIHKVYMLKNPAIRELLISTAKEEAKAT